MELKTLTFNNITKWYNNNLLIVDNLVVKEQWYRWQLIKICNILDIPIKDNLNIEYSNNLLVQKNYC